VFVDQAKVYVKGGDGGNGIVSYRRETFVPLGGPAGGDGGRGASVVFIVDEGLRTLVDFRYQRHFKADKGENGGVKNQHGKNAKDMLVKVPPGTVVRDAATDDLLGDLTRHGQELVVARGGRGGRGNTRFASDVNKAPDMAEKGEPGQERDVILELKVLADVGLVGFPSVGKSTLLSVVSAAKPKIGDYHFTTLSPQLGVVDVGDGRSFVLADIPGLIEGAHTGQGLGHEFLRHVERTKVLVHVLDMAGVEERDPIEDFQIIREELFAYDVRLNERPQLVLANKMDLVDAEVNLERFRGLHPDIPVYPVSGVTKQGLQAALYAIADVLDNIEENGQTLQTLDDKEQAAVNPAERIVYRYEKKAPFVIRREGGEFVVESEEMELLVKMTNFTQYDATQRFARIMKQRGVDAALRKRGAKDGDAIRIGEMVFDFVE